jgi:hypothetical protein
MKGGAAAFSEEVWGAADANAGARADGALKEADDAKAVADIDNEPDAGTDADARSGRVHARSCRARNAWLARGSRMPSVAHAVHSMGGYTPSCNSLIPYGCLLVIVRHIMHLAGRPACIRRMTLAAPSIAVVPIAPAVAKNSRSCRAPCACMACACRER